MHQDDRRNVRIEEPPNEQTETPRPEEISDDEDVDRKAPGRSRPKPAGTGRSMPAGRPGIKKK